MSRFSEIKKMLENDPNDPFLNYALALEYYREINIPDNLSKTISILESLLQNHEDYLATYYMLGHIYIHIDQKEKAIPVFQKGIEVAKKQNDRRTLRELNESLLMLED